VEAPIQGVRLQLGPESVTSLRSAIWPPNGAARCRDAKLVKYCAGLILTSCIYPPAPVQNLPILCFSLGTIYTMLCWKGNVYKTIDNKSVAC